MRGALLAVVVVAGGGCDLVFGPDVAGTDAAAVADARPPPGDTGPQIDDEDADGVPNAVDDCPNVSDPAQQRVQDADLVGDACDPHPSTDGDVIVRFFAFDDPLLDVTEWEDHETTDDFHFQPGQVAHTDQNDGFTLLEYIEPALGTIITVDAIYRYVDWSLGPAPRVGVRIDGGAGIGCWAEPDRVLVQESLADNGSAESTLMPDMSAGEEFRVRGIRDGDALRATCMVERSLGTFTSPEVTSSMPWDQNGTVGVDTRYASVILRSFVVYAVP